jgi:hypothetical protein
MTDLVKVDSNVTLVKGGVGLNSKYTRIRPDRIVIVQPTSKTGTPGKFRFDATGEEFAELQLVHLQDREGRTYFEGTDFKVENLVCYSENNIVPSKNARIPQSLDCASCAHSDWTKYRQSRNILDLPKCKEVLHALVLERSSGLPFKFDIRGKSIGGYAEALQIIARKCVLMQAKGLNPNVYDFSFKISLVRSGTYYAVKVVEGSVGLIKEDEREKFGDLYVKYVSELEREKMEADEALREAKEIGAVEADLTTGGEL